MPIKKPGISGLYAITPDSPDTADLLLRVRLALTGGARVVQYRDKSAYALLDRSAGHKTHPVLQRFGVGIGGRYITVLQGQQALFGLLAQGVFNAADEV